MTNSPKSRDGYQWTQSTGLIEGVPTPGLIQPSTHFTRNKLYDVIVIGGGYAGLTTCRDLALAGNNVLLVEARDRIGGRSWSSNIDGYAYEMGGTWVHWHQPFVWRELRRYGMMDQLEVSPRKNVEGDATVESAFKKFINVDGQFGRSVIPYPHDIEFNMAGVQEYDHMSMAERMAQVSMHLTPLEKNMFEGFLAITHGAKWEEASFFELLRWWALMNYNFPDFMAIGLTYKLRDGQSTLARRIFDEAVATGRLDYTFSTPVKDVVDHGHGVEVTARNGVEVFKGRRLVCTVPLNVLHTLAFTPALPTLKTEASLAGHVNQVVKCHAEVANPEMRSLGATNYPSGRLTYTFGDGTTPAGNTHLVAFGSSLPGSHLDPEQDIQVTKQAFEAFHPDMKVQRLVFHNWHKDEFARGAWEWLRPGMTTKYLHALRERHGNVFFASSDSSFGWRGFIDGAIDDGGRVAKIVHDELRVVRPVGSKL
ncbi:Monoamine oxidase N [Penicillium subrubescens]|uniref:Monoamine oxidase N n=1 Tax=Penicillium subrubescens TaxID=1316194 RepID=UPI00254506AA|nr:Monoamine oxidase N [Penicillium subrubescens]KAJ5892050.1 Monoamine oxidase N [Penicillium subrubescens]